METNAFSEPTHQFSLQNPNFPPVLSAGECQIESTDTSGPSTSGSAKLVLSVLTPQDVEVAHTFGCACFQRSIVEMHDS
eukprot:9024507-Ditylum_brightwellii.AAC.1